MVYNAGLNFVPLIDIIYSLRDRSSQKSSPYPFDTFILTLTWSPLFLRLALILPVVIIGSQVENLLVLFELNSAIAFNFF